MRPGGRGTHTFNPSTWEADAGGAQGVRGQPGLQSEFQDSQDCYTEKPCLEKPKKKKNNRMIHVGVGGARFHPAT